MSNNNKVQVDKFLYFVPIVIILGICIYFGLNLEKASKMVDAAFAFITGSFSWFYHGFTFGCLVLTLYFMFGKYGSLKLGEGEPEFSNFSWLSMIFTAALGGSLMIWATIEPFYYVMGPPFQLEPFSVEAYTYATAYPLFHWGFTGNSMYSVLAVIFGYFFFVRKQDVNRGSTACAGLLGEKAANGIIGKIIDVFLIIAIIGGIATTLGLSTPLAGELIYKLFGVPRTMTMDVVLIIIWTIIISITVYSGLQKGIKIISNVRMYLIFASLAFTFIFGPKIFMLNNFVEGLGTMMNEFFKMSFYTDPFSNNEFNGFPQWWTVFYWAWWATYASQMGIYFSRISKGRTVRATCAAILLATGAGVWIFFAVFGNYTLHSYINGALPNLPDILTNQGNAAAVVEVWNTLPFNNLFLFAMLAMVFLATITLLNGTAYTLALITSKKIGADQEPAGWNRISWVIVLGSLALILLAIGGLRAIQTSSIVASFPIIFIFIIIIVGFFKVAKEDDWGGFIKKAQKDAGIE